MTLSLLAAWAAVLGGAEPLLLDAIHVRDPFIVPVPEEGVYYLYGSRLDDPAGNGFRAWTSRDLERWEGPVTVFEPGPDFWSDRDFWAPEVHRHGGRYYLFASFKSADRRRGTQILVADGPLGPFRPHSDGPVTPADWECLDGTLHTDAGGKPWMVFCHEWVQIRDGGMCLMPLRDDLSGPAGPPVTLFRASDAPWARPIGNEGKDYVTDGPFLHRTASGALLMLWSSFNERGYAMGVARSRTGTVAGPWDQDPEPLVTGDGGHGMVFRTFDGDLMLTYHQPNRGPDERPRLVRLIERGDRLAVAEETEP